MSTVLQIENAPNSMSAISIQGLTKKFGSFTALDSMTIEVSEGEIFGLLGPNGAGKTTTMRILSCLIKPTYGFAFVDGMNVLDQSKTVEIRKRIGLLTENPNIYERLTADQNLRFFALAYSMKESEIDGAITDVLRTFDLLDRRKDKAGNFSKGMKQKLAIARAIIHKPSILLLDEPTATLDAESAKSIRELISETTKKYGHTVLMSTHNLDDASRLCDRIAILSRGRILACGTEAQLGAELRRSDSGVVEPPKLKIELLDKGVFSVEKLRANVAGIVDAKEQIQNSHSRFEFTLDGRLSELDLDLLISKIVSVIVGLGGEITLAEPIKPTLEDIYLKVLALSKEKQN